MTVWRDLKAQCERTEQRNDGKGAPNHRGFFFLDVVDGSCCGSGAGLVTTSSEGDVFESRFLLPPTERKRRYHHDEQHRTKGGADKEAGRPPWF